MILPRDGTWQSAQRNLEVTVSHCLTSDDVKGIISGTMAGWHLPVAIHHSFGRIVPGVEEHDKKAGGKLSLELTSTVVGGCSQNK